MQLQNQSQWTMKVKKVMLVSSSMLLIIDNDRPYKVSSF